MNERAAARYFGVSRESVRKMLEFSVPPGYRRTAPVHRPKLDGCHRTHRRVAAGGSQGRASQAAAHGEAHLRACSRRARVHRRVAIRSRCPPASRRSLRERHEGCVCASRASRRKRSRRSPDRYQASGAWPSPSHKAPQARAPDQGAARPSHPSFPYLITHNPQPGPGHDGRSTSWERGLPARGKLTKAALRAPFAGKEARAPRRPATLESSPDRAEDCS